MHSRDGRSHLHFIPEELSLKIIRIATDSPVRRTETLAELPPFECIRYASSEVQSWAAMRIKLSLAQTNSYLRRLALPYLYEAIWIHHGAEALLQVLQSSKGCSGLGKYVQHIIIPHSTHAVASDVLAKIVGCCPEVRILTRPSAAIKHKPYQPLLTNDLAINSDALTKVTRIDWNNTPTDNAEASSISPPFIWSSQSLRVLTLGSANFKDFANVQEGDQSLEVVQTEINIDLPNVHTLKLRTLDALGDPFSHWYTAKLPSLRRIVLEAPAGLYPLYEGCLTFYGPRIEVIEFGTHVGFLRIDALALALFYCPNVKELCFPVFNTMPVRKNPLDVPDAEYRFYKVERVVMHGFAETEAGYQISRSWMTTHFADFIDGLCGEGTRFTSLKTIVLFGSEWKELLEDSFIDSLMAISTDKGLRIERQEW